MALSKKDAALDKVSGYIFEIHKTRPNAGISCIEVIINVHMRISVNDIHGYAKTCHVHIYIYMHIYIYVYICMCV